MIRNYYLKTKRVTIYCNLLQIIIAHYWTTLFFFFFFHYNYWKKRKARQEFQEPTWTVVAISNVPWFATTVEGPFDVGAGGIFATIVRDVQAFVCVWVIILVNFKFILPEETGRQ